jgi:acetyl esterase/lipase
MKALFKLPAWLRLALGLICFFICGSASAAEPAPAEITVVANLAYRSGAGLTRYETRCCKLDLYLPPANPRAPLLVWFHGGFLEGGSKGDAFTQNIARSLAQSGVAVAVPDYRLSPKVKYPAYLDDAAAAVAWLRTNNLVRGYDREHIFIGGHSAGGYLTLMLGLDDHWLQSEGLSEKMIAGLIPISGQTMTHSTVRAERGLPSNAIIADAAAPIYHARRNTPPLLVFFAEHDMPTYVQQNQLLVAALKADGDTNVTARLIPNRNHGSIAENIKYADDPVHTAIVRFIISHSGPKR